MKINLPRKTGLRRGFTLIEFPVVIATIAILPAAASRTLKGEIKREVTSPWPKTAQVRHDYAVIQWIAG